MSRLGVLTLTRPAAEPPAPAARKPLEDKPDPFAERLQEASRTTTEADEPETPVAPASTDKDRETDPEGSSRPENEAPDAGEEEAPASVAPADADKADEEPAPELPSAAQDQPIDAQDPAAKPEGAETPKLEPDDTASRAPEAADQQARPGASAEPTADPAKPVAAPIQSAIPTSPTTGTPEAGVIPTEPVGTGDQVSIGTLGARRLSFQSLTEMLLTADPAVLRARGLTTTPEPVAQTTVATQQAPSAPIEDRPIPQPPRATAPAPIAVEGDGTPTAQDENVPARTPSPSAASKGAGEQPSAAASQPAIAEALSRAEHNVVLAGATGAAASVTAERGASAQPVALQIATSGPKVGALDSASASFTGGQAGAGEGQNAAARLARVASAERTDPAALRAQVMRGLAAAMRSKDGAVTLRMRPGALGAMRVHVTKGEGSVAARFEVESAQTQKTLEQSLATLRSALEARGIDVDRIEVEVVRFDQTPSDHQEQGEQRHHGAARDSRMGAGRSDAGAEPQPEEPESPGGWAASDDGELVRLTLDTIG